MKRLLLIFITLLFFTLPYISFAEIELKLSTFLPLDVKDAGHNLMTSPSQFRKAFFVIRNGIKFIVCPDENNVIVHISTKDKSFLTPEKIGIGDTYEIVQRQTHNKPQVLPGFGFVIHLNSGWSALFTQGETLSEGSLKQNTKVISLYRGVD